jgi:hypothetical protein
MEQKCGIEINKNKKLYEVNINKKERNNSLPSFLLILLLHDFIVSES